MSAVMGVRFRPTDAELIKCLKRFFKGELSLSQQCRIQFADIYGDQPPWEIFGADSEEKVRYFITPLKKRKSEYARFCRICAKGTWKGQTGEHRIRNNRNGTVVGYRRSFMFVTKEDRQNKTWLMKEYSVADDFFRENSHIRKQDFVVCRIKKKTNKEEVNPVEIQDSDVAAVIDAMLFTPEGMEKNNEDEDEWDSIINTVCDQNNNNEDEDEWDSIINRVCDQNNNTTTMEKKDTTEIEGQKADYDIEIFKDIPVDIPDDWFNQQCLP